MREVSKIERLEKDKKRKGKEENKSKKKIRKEIKV